MIRFGVFAIALQVEAFLNSRLAENMVTAVNTLFKPKPDQQLSQVIESDV